jgi:hypothetical protein
MHYIYDQNPAREDQIAPPNIWGNPFGFLALVSFARTHAEAIKSGTMTLPVTPLPSFAIAQRGDGRSGGVYPRRWGGIALLVPLTHLSLFVSLLAHLAYEIGPTQRVKAPLPGGCVASVEVDNRLVGLCRAVGKLGNRDSSRLDRTPLIESRLWLSPILGPSPNPNREADAQTRRLRAAHWERLAERYQGNDFGTLDSRLCRDHSWWNFKILALVEESPYLRIYFGDLRSWVERTRPGDIIVGELGRASDRSRDAGESLEPLPDWIITSRY